MSNKNSNRLNGVFIVPAGLGYATGGDAGALTQANLIAGCCETLISHPNVLNASDINCMADNILYVEGSTINRFLSGEIYLDPVKTYNKILCLTNKITPATINAVNAARHTLGADIEIKRLNVPLIMCGGINSDGLATSYFLGHEELIRQVKDYNFDNICLHTPIECEKEVVLNYWKNGGANPWGKVESDISKVLSRKLNKQVVHSPVETQEDFLCEELIVKKSQAPEIISLTYAWCMFKGNHIAPHISLFSGMRNKDISFMISPYNCWSDPHMACQYNGIPIIIVKENTNVMKDKITYPDYSNLIFVENYLEACGVVCAMNSRINFKEIYKQYE